jgi:UDP-N-acetylenolpyruvoylglucosamine reductase
MNFSYRNSIIKEKTDYFVTKVIFDLSKVVEKYSSNVDFLAFRRGQPK